MVYEAPRHRLIPGVDDDDVTEEEEEVIVRTVASPLRSSRSRRFPDTNTVSVRMANN